MKSSDSLPLTVEELTASWFTKILGKPVKDAAIVKEIHGTASKILMKLTFDNSAENDNTPTRVCVKGGFSPALVASLPFMFAVYRLEAEFYYYLAPQIAIPLPPLIYAGTDTVKGQGIVILADLEATGYTFGNPLEPWSVNRVKASVQQLAVLHASTWGNTGEEHIPSLGETVSLRDAIIGLLTPEEWNKRFAPGTRPPVPEHMEDRERITAVFKALWSSNTKLNCLVHGDAHIGNTFISPLGEPGFLDWQVIHAGSAMHDVAYFIIGSLSIEDRRNHEKELLQAWLDALYRSNGPEFQLEEVWGEYQRQTFHGFAWALAGPMMQSREIVDAMTERHCAAIEDHKSIELLERMEK
ncbi:aminoglycoside phosphotransferase [Fusarium mundagurra]|uniref:Aminoglycoside phosphotransferase n=1 Tax=Fusarium mundagurra TaxID=1567541 RepID=A0A8H5YME6_9HYPO|nr:aminoglycoside phosphotransferase [Fusarium mundagurra]